MPKGRNFDSLISIARSWKRVQRRVPRCPWCFLNKYKTIRLEKTAQHWETKGKFSFATNPLSPTNFQETYFPCSLDSALQILNRGREQAYETRSGASLRQSRSWISRPMRCSWKGCPAIVASSGGPRNPTPWAFPPLFVDLEGSRRLGIPCLASPTCQAWQVPLVKESDGAGGSIAARRRTTHTVKLGSFKKWRQWQTPAS